MKKIAHILVGWGKRLGFVSTSTAEAKLSELRLKQCAACDLSKESQVLSLINGAATVGASLKCTVCLCPCYEKTIVIDETCPEGKW